MRSAAPIIIFCESPEIVSQSVAVTINHLVKTHRIFLIPDSRVLTFRMRMMSRHMVQLHTLRHRLSSHVTIVTPAALLPFQRIPIIASINHLFALVTVWRELKRYFHVYSFRSFHPVVYVIAHHPTFTHWFYVPGILKERYCIVDFSLFRSPIAEDTFSRYLHTVVAYADLIIPPDFNRKYRGIRSTVPYRYIHKFLDTYDR